MKKIVCVIMTVVMSLSILAVPAFGGSFQPNFETAAPAAYVLNTDTGVVMYEKDAYTQYSAASLTKLVTTMLLLEKVEDLDARTFKAVGSVFDTLSRYSGISHADIKRNAELTGRELLYAMMLPSANEAAYTVAYGLGNGSVSNFVFLMNAKAKQMGCLNTTFVDPSGLEPGNMTTAYDMAQIIKYMTTTMERRELFAEVCKTTKYEMPAGVGFSTSNSYWIWTEDLLVDEGRGDKYYRECIQGGKTGSLEDWQNFAGWAQKDGMSFITVVLNVPNERDEYHFEFYPTNRRIRPALFETCRLMDWVYGNFKIDNALDTENFATEIQVKYATEADMLKLYPKQGLYSILPNESDYTTVKKTYDLPETVAAPVKQGDVIGSVTLSLADEEIGAVELIAGSDIERNEVLYLLSRVGDFFTSLYFKVVLVLTALTVAGYLALYVAAGFRRRKDKRIHKPRRGPWDD